MGLIDHILNGIVLLKHSVHITDRHFVFTSTLYRQNVSVIYKDSVDTSR